MQLPATAIWQLCFTLRGIKKPPSYCWLGVKYYQIYISKSFLLPIDKFRVLPAIILTSPHEANIGHGGKTVNVVY